MKLLVMPRQVGKTTTLIGASRATGIPICVYNNLAKEYLMEQAREYLISGHSKTHCREH